jgi:hypothetical protein
MVLSRAVYYAPSVLLQTLPTEDTPAASHPRQRGGPADRSDIPPRHSMAHPQRSAIISVSSVGKAHLQVRLGHVVEVIAVDAPDEGQGNEDDRD